VRRTVVFSPFRTQVGHSPTHLLVKVVQHVVGHGLCKRRRWDDHDEIRSSVGCFSDQLLGLPQGRHATADDENALRLNVVECFTDCFDDGETFGTGEEHGFAGGTVDCDAVDTGLGESVCGELPSTSRAAFREGNQPNPRHPPLYMLRQRLVINLLLLVTLVEREDGDVDACVVIAAVQRRPDPGTRPKQDLPGRGWLKRDGMVRTGRGGESQGIVRWVLVARWVSRLVGWPSKHLPPDLLGRLEYCYPTPRQLSNTGPFDGATLSRSEFSATLNWAEVVERDAVGFGHRLAVTISSRQNVQGHLLASKIAIITASLPHHVPSSRTCRTHSHFPRLATVRRTRRRRPAFRAADAQPRRR
jgi:hypothetical protein